MSYLIPTEEIALANQERLRQAATKAGMERALELKLASVGPIERYSGLVARDADYVTDFVPVATSAGLAGWLSMPLAAIGILYSIFANNVPAALTPQVPNNQVVVFYKVSVLTLAGPDPVSMLFFRTGVGANLKAQFDLEALYGKMVSDGYFTKPVVYDPMEIITSQVEARVAIGVGCRVRLGTLIIEPIQVTLV